MKDTRLVIEIDESYNIRIQHTIPEHYGVKSVEGWQEVYPKQQQEVSCIISNIAPVAALEGLTELLKAVISKGDTAKVVHHLLETIEESI